MPGSPICRNVDIQLIFKVERQYMHEGYKHIKVIFKSLCVVFIIGASLSEPHIVWWLIEFCRSALWCVGSFGLELSHRHFASSCKYAKYGFQ